jgi:hypothetical protein
MNLERPEGFEVRFIQAEGWCPASRHNNCLFRALNWGADVMCFMGADHWVEEDTLVRLYKHLEDGWDMAAGWVPSRGVCGPDKIPFEHLAFKLKEGVTPRHKKPVLDFRPDEFEVITHGAESQQIHTIGTGILMFHSRVISGMDQPYFFEFIRNDGTFSRIPVQDTHFTYRCTVEHGNRLWLDTSIQAVHLDVFPIDDTYKDKFMEHQGDRNWSPSSQLGVKEDEKPEQHRDGDTTPIRGGL